MRILRARWVTVAVFTLALIAFAALMTWRATPQYASTSRIFVSTTGDASNGLAFQGGTFTLDRVASYADLFTGKEISRRVVDQLKLDESPEALAGQISAKANLDTVILSVTVTDQSPDRAK